MADVNVQRVGTGTRERQLEQALRKTPTSCRLFPRADGRKAKVFIHPLVLIGDFLPPGLSDWLLGCLLRGTSDPSQDTAGRLIYTLHQTPHSPGAS